jgi:polyphenol oxidase
VLSLTAEVTPGAIARFALTDRWEGISTGRYRERNLATHVGDVPADVAANRSHLAAQLLRDPFGCFSSPPTVIFMHQVHGNRVVTVQENRLTDSEFRNGCDGLVTDRPGLVLAVLVADCVPVLMSDPVAGVVGVAHAGRLGTALGVATQTIDAMCALGAVPERIAVRLGPSICGMCYEVPEQLRDEVDAVVPGSASLSRQGTPSLDLRAGLIAQLAQRGVTAKAVGPCTAESSHYFSYRREATTGRFAGLTWVTPLR